MRTMPSILMLALCFLIASLAGCDTDPIGEHDRSPHYPEYGAGDTAVAYRGEIFEFVLYNASNDAGYSWYISEDFDQDIAEFVKKYNVVVNPYLVGSPVYEHWQYRAASQGTTTARYKLYQYWIGEGMAIDSAYATVIVH